MTIAGIVLCGGASRRMGQSKAWLKFGGEPLLVRVVRILSQAVTPVITVAGPNQSLPELPGDVHIARDPVEYQGPLVGLAAGLALVPSGTSHVFVTGCDAPFLSLALVKLMVDRALPGRSVVPTIDDIRQPLPAVYPFTISATIQSLLDAGARSLRSLVDHVPIDELHEYEIKSVDPRLAAFRPMNYPDDYHDALRQ